MNTTIETPLAIYVDESGSPELGKPRTSDGHPQGYAICAVAVPALTGPRAHATLPRGTAGQLLKASDREMDDSRLADALAELLTLELDVALVLIDASSPKNAATATELAEFSNERRRDRGNPATTAQHATYAFATQAAVQLAWERACSRMRAVIGHMDIVLDRFPLPGHARSLHAVSTANAFALQGLASPRTRWASRSDEPLLHIPDLFAAVYRRQATNGDAPHSMAVLESAAGRRRIVIEDRFSTPGRPPDPD